MSENTGRFGHAYLTNTWLSRDTGVSVIFKTILERRYQESLVFVKIEDFHLTAKLEQM